MERCGDYWLREEGGLGREGGREGGREEGREGGRKVGGPKAVTKEDFKAP
jgi:hypothetical protein